MLEIALAAWLLLLPATAGQHMHPGAPGKPAEMTSALFFGLPMAREGSGTSWLPDATVVPAWHLAAGRWTFMVHGAAFLRFTSQDAFRAGTRGGERLDGPNWAMISVQPPRGPRGGFFLRGMFSLDPVTEGGRGYPLLFQTGESWRGEALVDRQHPHDLLAELSAAYGLALGPEAGAFVYLGFPGEPALGPAAFMHRPSSRTNPDAPLGHHLQDSTHIAFGVLTSGVRYGGFKLDASLFNGREPDEDRFGFDRPRLDSWSVRLSLNPSSRTAVQVSHGFLRSPEALKPGIDVRRTTASLVLTYPLSGGGDWATALVWGMNEPAGLPRLHSLLLDSEASLGRAAAYARLEFVQRTGHDLKLGDSDERVFPVGAATVGLAMRIASRLPFDLRAGGQATLYSIPSSLRPIYGRGPVSLEVFLRAGPPLPLSAAAPHH